MLGWLRKNWLSLLLAVFAILAFAKSGIYQEIISAKWDQPSRPVFSLEKIQFLSDKAEDEPGSRTLRMKFILHNSGNLPADDFLLIPSFGGMQSNLSEEQPHRASPGQRIEAVAAYSRPADSARYTLDIKIELNYSHAQEHYTQEWFFIYNPENGTIEAVSRPVFVVERTEAAGDEVSEENPSEKLLKLKFVLRNSGNLPADDFTFVLYFSGSKSSPAGRPPAKVLPGQRVEINGHYLRSLDDAGNSVEVKVALTYRYARESYTQEWFFIYHPESMAIEPLDRSVFVVEKVQVLRDEVDPEDGSRRLLNTKFVLRNSGNLPVEDFLLVPSFDGKQSSEPSKEQYTVLPGQMLELKSNYYREADEAVSPVEINIRIDYTYAGEARSEEWVFLYHSDRRAIELTRFGKK
jgi:hypothetical protein